MLKNCCLFIILFFIGFGVRAQSADSVYNRYLDFNLARFQGEPDKVLELGEQLIPLANKLPDKARINFYAAAGKMYEDADQPDKAIPLYEKVTAAVPDYYVAHRALGYLYLDKAKAIEQQLNAGNRTDKAKLTSSYIAIINKALPHLEKAQACDPSDETLTIIKLLYQNIKDDKGLGSLNNRLKKMSKNCIDILTDK